MNGPMLMEGPLVGKKVIGAAVGRQRSLVWTEEDEVYSFGTGGYDEHLDNWAQWHLDQLVH